MSVIDLIMEPSDYFRRLHVPLDDLTALIRCYTLDHDNTFPLSFPSFKVNSDVGFCDEIRHSYGCMH